MDTKTKVFKIRQISTGKFSDGGQYPHLISEGKIWKRLGNVKNHLNYFKDKPLYGHNSGPAFNDLEIVTFEIEFTQTETTSVTDYLDMARKLEAEREKVYRKETIRKNLEFARKRLEETEKEYNETFNGLERARMKADEK